MSRLLLVDDDDALTETLSEALTDRGHVVRPCRTAPQALEAVAGESFDVVIADLEMPGPSGIVLCEKVAASEPYVPVVMLSAFGSYDTAVAAMRAGAYDFLTKPVPLDVLSGAIDRATEHRRAHERVHAMTEEIALARDGDATIVAAGAAMSAVLERARRAAVSDVTVLISGESGSGKEVVAREIHRASRRRDGPFVAINCAAVPEALLESELFGHVRGAFTDARVSQPGLFAAASGGTLFLDEIGEMPLAVQPKLLRALQERTVRPVGGSTEVPIDVRVVAATNRDLERAVAERSFRADLFYRINVIRIGVPPLRSRTEDILALAARFLAENSAAIGRPVTSLAPATIDHLLRYPWPGNVRELRNCIEHAVALSRFDHVVPADLPQKVRAYDPSFTVEASDEAGRLEPLEVVERRHVSRVLEAVDGNKSAAARVLGIDRKRLYRLLARFGHE